MSTGGLPVSQPVVMVSVMVGMTHPVVQPGHLAVAVLVGVLGQQAFLFDLGFLLDFFFSLSLTFFMIMGSLRAGNLGRRDPDDSRAGDGVGWDRASSLWAFGFYRLCFD